MKVGVGNYCASTVDCENAVDGTDLRGGIVVRDAVIDTVGSGIGTIRASADTPWITTLAGRVGLTLDHALVYFKIGGGWVRNDAVITNLASNATVTASNTNGGWLIGAGAEYAFPFLPHWSAKLEYEFLGLADQTGLALIRSGTFDFSRDVQLLKFGISYKFN